MTFQILDHENYKNDILHDNIGQTIEKRIFKMSEGGSAPYDPTNREFPFGNPGNPPCQQFPAGIPEN